MLKKLQGKKGFTLIELLVVIAIIAILAALIILNLNTARKKARDAKRKTDMAEMQTALESYSDDHNGSFPTSATTIFLKTGLLSTYIVSDVKDPKNSASFVYTYISDGVTYKVCATLEMGGTFCKP